MRFSNILQLGIKELRGLGRDTLMLVLIVYAFSLFEQAIVARAASIEQ